MIGRNLDPPGPTNPKAPIAEDIEQVLFTMLAAFEDLKTGLKPDTLSALFPNYAKVQVSVRIESTGATNHVWFRVWVFEYVSRQVWRNGGYDLKALTDTRLRRVPKGGVYMEHDEGQWSFAVLSGWDAGEGVGKVAGRN